MRLHNNIEKYGYNNELQICLIVSGSSLQKVQPSVITFISLEQLTGRVQCNFIASLVVSYRKF